MRLKVNYGVQAVRPQSPTWEIVAFVASRYDRRVCEWAVEPVAGNGYGRVALLRIRRAPSDVLGRSIPTSEFGYGMDYLLHIL